MEVNELDRKKVSEEYEALIERGKKEIINTAMNRCDTCKWDPHKNPDVCMKCWKNPCVTDMYESTGVGG